MLGSWAPAESALTVVGGGLGVLWGAHFSCSLAAKERSDCRQGGPPGATLARGLGARSPLE